MSHLAQQYKKPEFHLDNHICNERTLLERGCSCETTNNSAVSKVILTLQSIAYICILKK